MSKKEGAPNVLGADRFYMTKEAIKNLEKAGKFAWADCKNEDELIEKSRALAAEVIISEYFKLTKHVIDSSPALKGIVVWGVGYDHVDLEAASDRGIYVANTRGSNAESVAEHVFAFILNLSRKLIQDNAFVRKGGWISREESGLPYELTAHDLCQKTMGIVGFGLIGTLVARIAHGFNMRVLAYDPYLTAQAIEEKGAQPISLEKLLRESDFVTLHVVLTQETKNMISTKQLNSMKPTAYLINASRGAVIDEFALVKALEEKKIAGAALDVFVSEPADLKNPLLKFDTVIVSPHCAGNSEEALNTTSLVVSQEVTRILQGKVPQNLVNKPQLMKKGYLN